MTCRACAHANFMLTLYSTKSRQNLFLSFCCFVLKSFASLGVDMSQPGQKQKKNEKSKIDSVLLRNRIKIIQDSTVYTCPNRLRIKKNFHSRELIQINHVLLHLLTNAPTQFFQKRFNISFTFQAFLIAFTSSFLPKLLYRFWISPDQSLNGYTNYSLAWAPPNTYSQPCR